MFFRILPGQKLGQQGPNPKLSSISFEKQQKEIKSFPELLILSKYHWSFDWVMNDFLWRAVLCDILLPFLAETDVHNCCGWKWPFSAKKHHTTQPEYMYIILIEQKVFESLRSAFVISDKKKMFFCLSWAQKSQFLEVLKKFSRTNGLQLKLLISIESLNIFHKRKTNWVWSW